MACLDEPPLRPRGATMTDLDLLIEAAQHDNLQTVQSILDRNQEAVNERDASGATALHYAALNGHRRIAKLLFERGADINNRVCFSRVQEPTVTKTLTVARQAMCFRKHGCSHGALFVLTSKTPRSTS